MVREQDKIQESIAKIMQENPGTLQVGKSKIGLTLQKLVNKCVKYPKLEGLLATAQSAVQTLKAKIISELFGSVENNLKNYEEKEQNALDSLPEKEENAKEGNDNNGMMTQEVEATKENGTVPELAPNPNKSEELPAKICEELEKQLLEVLYQKLLGKQKAGLEDKEAHEVAAKIEQRIREKDPEMTNKYQESVLQAINSLKEAKDIEAAKALVQTLTIPSQPLYF
eukprot:TRINITY_DN1103_c0_g1_i1.p10 TRINITY_DN1103_c0_g1~~TRINITY_DN1103_c0_g1_i1.p10  ORF type:complete len:226 (+),score=36.39 TRINITY_DN1103_c0_g1_i1:2915-3592(+)